MGRKHDSREAATASEPLSYERVVMIRKLESTESLMEEGGEIKECVRECFDTYRWNDLEEICFSVSFSKQSSGFKVGDKIRIVIERIETGRQGGESDGKKTLS